MWNETFMEGIKEQLLVRYVPPVLEELYDARGWMREIRYS